MSFNRVAAPRNPMRDYAYVRCRAGKGEVCSAVMVYLLLEDPKNPSGACRVRAGPGAGQRASEHSSDHSNRLSTALQVLQLAMDRS